MNHFEKNYMVLLERLRANADCAHGFSADFRRRNSSVFGPEHDTSVVETNRPALKNAQYDTVVRQGDILLASVQRLSKVLY